jgi:hypothetical protein
LKLIFLIVTRVVSVLGQSRRQASEILMLRHQLAVALRDPRLLLAAGGAL